MALRDFPLPGLLFFTNANSFTGSYRGINYRVDPIEGKPEEDIAPHFKVAVWDGEKCSELSEMKATARFSLDEDGLAATESWLREQYQEFANAE